MAKFNVRAFHVKAPIDFNKAHEDAVFKPCANGAEMSVGLIAAGPAQEKLVWEARGLQFMEYAVEERRVPKKWLEAEMRRRTLPGMNLEQLGQLKESIKAELWNKIPGVKKYGWVCYDRDRNLLLVAGSTRHVEYVTGVVRLALGSLQIDNAFEVHGFELMVQAFIAGELEPDGLELGRQVNMYEGSGKSKSVVSFKNYDLMEENEHIYEHMKRCRGVASAGFMLDGVEENVDDVVASPYAELVITETKDKEADEYGTILVRADRAIAVVETLNAAMHGYRKETGVEV